jgi:hypothetical protein
MGGPISFKSSFGGRVHELEKINGGFIPLGVSFIAFLSTVHQQVF